MFFFTNGWVLLNSIKIGKKRGIVYEVNIKYLSYVGLGHGFHANY